MPHEPVVRRKDAPGADYRDRAPRLRAGGAAGRRPDRQSPGQRHPGLERARPPDGPGQERQRRPGRPPVRHGERRDVRRGERPARAGRPRLRARPWCRPAGARTGSRCAAAAGAAQTCSSRSIPTRPPSTTPSWTPTWGRPRPRARPRAGVGGEVAARCSRRGPTTARARTRPSRRAPGRASSGPPGPVSSSATCRPSPSPTRASTSVPARPSLASVAYAAAFAEVKVVGNAAIADAGRPRDYQYWSRARSSQPPGAWLQVALTVASAGP